MKPIQHLERLDLSTVLGPFDALGDALAIAIDTVDGRVVAGSADRSRDRAVGAIVVHGETVGHVVLHGPAADTPVVRTAAQAIAAAISVAAGATVDPKKGRRTAQSILDAELAHGRRLQRAFVSLVPPEVPGYDLASHYEAAREVGGDFFDLFRLRRRGRPLSIVIADVTGKGVAAALLMAFSRPLLHAAIDHVPDPSAALARTNQILVSERRTGLFITALVARLDLRSGVLRMANAGHEPPLFIPGDGSPVGFVLGSGPLLGAFADFSTPEVEAHLAPGDVVLFYTDGVTDASSPSGERFDEDGLLAAVDRARGGSAPDVVREVGDAVASFSAGAAPADDITVVAVGRQRARAVERRRRAVTPPGATP